MSYFNRVFAARFLKALLIVCCIGLLVAAIWFLGPFFGFGESRPLLSIESRIIFILLAVFCLVSCWLRWPVFIVITAALCVLVWVLGPFLLVGGKTPVSADQRQTGSYRSYIADYTAVWSVAAVAGVKR
ncbi:type VI secretion protein IcmF [Serratia plymuthica]|uniref:Type VI secretion protein IcmF n=1 Tax=Serratia plymuthica TaxID=82996 RepID=A0A2X4WZC0_SERPL|nr:type VI secretion protein IcmF [Serratia plymuthica]